MNTHGSVGQSPCRHLGAEALVDVVVAVDLHVDELRLVSVLGLELLGHVDHGPADPALAQARGGEHEHHRLLAHDVGEVLLVHGRRGHAGVDRLDVAAGVGLGRSIDHGRLVANGRQSGLAADRELRQRRGGSHQPAVEARHPEQVVRPRLVERDVRHVDGLRGVRVGGGGLALELRLDLERLVARHVRALGLPPAPRSDVDRRGGVGDLGPRRGEEPEAEPVFADGELRDRRREHRAGLRQLLAQLDQSLPGGARELLGLRLGRRFLRLFPGVVASATAGHERARENDGGDNAS